MTYKKRFICIIKVCALLLIIYLCVISAWIISYSNSDPKSTADAAIVLGAAVWDDRPSPVLRERLNHAIELYFNGHVTFLLLTGGIGEGDSRSEASISKNYVMAAGVPDSAILLEHKSKTTEQNLYFAKELADRYNIQKVLIVSDPFHLGRAVLMARDLGFEAEPSPTQTSRFRGSYSRFSFFISECRMLTQYLVRRPFSKWILENWTLR